MPSAWGHTRLLETDWRFITQESHCFSCRSVKEELTMDEPENFTEMQELVMKIKENAYQIVDSENYRVTTLEKEMKALYQGKRRLFPGNSLRKILEDNKEAYRDEDYGAINVYLIQNKITVYMPLEP